MVAKNRKLGHLVISSRPEDDGTCIPVVVGTERICPTGAFDDGVLVQQFIVPDKGQSIQLDGTLIRP